MSIHLLNTGIRQSLFSAAAPSLLLDLVPGGFGYSCRKLATDAVNAIRVRRSSDNGEQDIGFTGANVLDESALTTFVGANNGFVVTWYKQGTGDASNLTQATTTQQPRIVNAGTIEKINGFPVVRHQTAGDGAEFLAMTSWATRPSNATEFFVFRADTDRPKVIFVGSTSSNSSYFNGTCDDGSTVHALSRFVGDDVKYYKNNALVADDAINDSSNTRDVMHDGFVIGSLLLERSTTIDYANNSDWAQYSTSYKTSGGFDPIEYQFERVIYSALTAQQIIDAEANIAAHYGITLS